MHRIEDERRKAFEGAFAVARSWRLTLNSLETVCRIADPIGRADKENDCRAGEKKKAAAQNGLMLQGCVREVLGD